jgi:hypothetical protein
LPRALMLSHCNWRQCFWYNNWPFYRFFFFFFKKSFYENPPSLAVLLSSLLWHFPYFTPPSPFLSRSLCGYYIYGVITANRLTFRGKGQCLPLLPHHINYPHFNLIHSFFKKFVLSRDLFLTTTLPYLLHINIKSFLKSCPII